MHTLIQTFFNVAVLQEVATVTFPVTLRESFHLAKEVEGMVSAVITVFYFFLRKFFKIRHLKNVQQLPLCNSYHTRLYFICLTYFLLSS